MVTIGQTLQKLRESNSISGSSIAKAAGLSTATYYNIEWGYKEASFLVIFRICRFSEISLHEFADIVTPAELERPELTSIQYPFHGETESQTT
ncbi:helix-turn-helix domain-containing protein [Arcticibacter svalbardensis]|uniref:helix-turn-helix domain-containing protein n=1 Tax=Arcticibacter svalbardensis TaxID=1288027 RepID=UPI0003A4809E|nr:helix-turn-helix transcriptional regulator [Arcticibacter svalbardensis]